MKKYKFEFPYCRCCGVLLPIPRGTSRVQFSYPHRSRVYCKSKACSTQKARRNSPLA